MFRTSIPILGTLLFTLLGSAAVSVARSGPHWQLEPYKYLSASPWASSVMRQRKDRNIFILILLTGVEGTEKKCFVLCLRKPGPEPSSECLKHVTYLQSCPPTLASLCLLLSWKLLPCLYEILLNSGVSKPINADTTKLKSLPRWERHIPDSILTSADLIFQVFLLLLLLLFMTSAVVFLLNSLWIMKFIIFVLFFCSLFSLQFLELLSPCSLTLRSYHLLLHAVYALNAVSTCFIYLLTWMTFLSPPCCFSLFSILL